MKEIRTFQNVEFRTFEEEGKKYIEGYALKFQKDSRDMGFIEVIDRNAINDSTDLSDIVALFNHKEDYILARRNSKVNTLEILVDETGLKYRFEVDEDISYIRDLYKLIKKGEISESSFAFRINEDGEKWEKRGDGKYIRTITSFKGIYDVSVVTKGAYQDTPVDVRKFEDIENTLINEGSTDLAYNQYRYLTLFN
ncbi:HK97 family phage prohead protease [Litoribacter alkaliphilus]|uniref:HK97 family phage prohead protease n=1 Tax=Litoribacter ruber TaxID=702568 RepID=A0AAP2G2B6_9BACT|nr:HK97 family phage prohead protease [Litoribacter alkaliphilus]MBS9525919.1 HK97 family phage prohead protease [Litoribacter alkaliphilus]